MTFPGTLAESLVLSTLFPPGFRGALARSELLPPLREPIPTQRVLQPQCLPLKTLARVSAAVYSHGISHVAKTVTRGAGSRVYICPGRWRERCHRRGRDEGGGPGLLCYRVKGVTREASPGSSQRAALPELSSCSSILGKLRGSSEFSCTKWWFVSQGWATNGSTPWKASRGNCALPVTS